MKKLTIRLFGGLHLALDDQPFTGLPTRKAEALLVYLACQQRPFPREQLAEMLWDDRDPKQALANLRSILSSMRRKLKPYLTITRQTMAFNHDSNYWLDIAEFERRLGNRDQGLAAGSHETGDWANADPQSPVIDLRALQQAADLYRGPFLDGFYLRESRGFEEWALLERERLQRRALLVLRRLANHYLHTAQFPRAVPVARRLVELDDLQETAHRLLMLTLARNGERTRALAQYRRCQEILAEELDVEPAPETAVLATRIRRATERPRHNLPSHPTPFVGRQEEVADLTAQLADPACRLLTILGPGGAGKTRLALAAARKLIPAGLFLNGLRFIPLAGVTTPALIPALLAEELEMTPAGDAPLVEEVATALAEEEVLVILDNLEHLLEGETGEKTTAFLDGLLQNAPLVTLLVTSRQRLNLREEWVFDLAGLDLPAGEDPTAAEAAGAVQLFLQTVRQIQRHFAPGPADLAAIAAVCRALGGLPLGIELAAAWTRQLSPTAIAHRLRDDTDLLTTSLRNVPARHRSITAVFDHSWTLLSAAEQAILARLAGFRGDFTAEAAAAVADATPAILSALADKSLLQRENGRYTLHELLRQYAAEKLAGRPGEPAAAAARHAIYYLEWLSDQEDVENLATRQAILAELPNLRAAWEWGAAHPEEAPLGEAGIRLHRFYSSQSWFYEGIELFDETLRTLTAAPLTPSLAETICELLSRQAQMQIHIGRLEDARQTLDAAQAYLPHITDLKHHSAIAGYLAVAAFYAGEYERAKSLARESLDLAEQVEDEDGIAFALNFLGSCAKSTGDYEAAHTYFERAAAAYEAQGDKLGMAMTTHNLGNLAQARGNYAAAQTHYAECTQLFKELEHIHGAASTLVNAGRLAGKQGEWETAVALLREGLDLKQELRDERGMAVALCGLGEAALVQGTAAQAADHLHRALTLAGGTGDATLVLEALEALARLHAAGGKRQRAARLLAFVLAQAGTAQEVRQRAAALRQEFEEEEWETAVAWASRQTVDDVVAEARET